MAKVKTKLKTIKRLRVFYDSKGNTLTVWFGDPSKEYISEETGNEIILNKDRQGRVIGFEKLNVALPRLAKFEGLPLEVMVSGA